MADRRFALVGHTHAAVAEVNDLTAAVTWANVPDANITESSVTQHQAALSITESQISDLSHVPAGYNNTNWDTAYGWGDHSAQNYAVTTGDTFTGRLDVGNEGDSLRVSSTANGAAAIGYQTWYDGLAVRQGYLGMASAGSSDIYLASDVGDLRLVSGGLDIYLGCDRVHIDGKEAIDGNDAFMRLNQNSDFTSGVYTPGALRADGTSQFGQQKSSFGAATVSLSPTGNININPGGTFQLLSGSGARTYDAGNTNYLSLYCEDVATTSAHRSVAGNSAGGFLSMQHAGIADDATATFDIGGSYGIVWVVSTFNATTFAHLGITGTSAQVDYGSGSAVVTGATNPDTDSKVNIWPNTTGQISIKNRMGSHRNFYVMSFMNAA